MSNQLSNELITIDKSASLAEASEVMRDEGIHHLVVVSGKQLLGVLSDRDALDAWVRAGGVDLKKLKVADAYRKDIPSITPETSVQDAVALMQREYSDALLVELKGTVGIVTTMDLLKSLSSRTDPSRFDFAKLTFADPLLQKIMKTLSDIGI